MALWNKTTFLPKNLKGKEKRNVIVTNKGFVRRIKSGTRSKDEILIPLAQLSNTSNFNTAKVTDMWHSTRSTVNGSFVNTYISFSEPMKWAAGNVKITVANTAGGNNMIARSTATTVRGANNTLMVRWKAAGVGTFKIQSQTVANSTATAISLKSTNTGARNVVLVINGPISNNAGSVTVTA